MDTKRGTLYDDPVALRQALRERPLDVEVFEHDEVVQVKTGFFLVSKVDVKRQRVVLKPISAVEAVRRLDEVKRDAEAVARRAER